MCGAQKIVTRSSTIMSSVCVCVCLVFQESVASEQMEDVPSSMEDLKVRSGHLSVNPYLSFIFVHSTILDFHLLSLLRILST